jgi:hypothetical protein
VTWWLDMDIDPLPIARDLWDQSRARTSASNGHDVTKETNANVE